MPFKPDYRQFAPPQLRTPSFLPEPVYMESDIPEAEPGLQGPPPALQPPQVQINATIPNKPKSFSERYRQDILPNQPKPIAGWRRPVAAFARGGVPGLVAELVDPSAKRAKYAQDVNNLATEQKITHQQGQDELTDLYKRGQVDDMAARKEDRAERRADADLNRGLAVSNANWEDYSGPPEMTAPGEQPNWQYANINGRQVRRPTEYAKTKQRKDAEQATYREVPRTIATELGLAPGTKVPPNELDGYVRMIEARSSRAANDNLRRDLAQEANETRKIIAGIASSTRLQVADKQQETAGQKQQQGPKLTASQQNELGDIDTTAQLISELKGFYSDKNLEGVGPVRGPAGQAMQSWFGAGSDEAKQVRSLIGNLRGTITKLRAGTALSKTEKAMLDTYTPDINEDGASVMSKAAGLEKYLSTRRENLLKYAADPYASHQQTQSPTKPAGGPPALSPPGAPPATSAAPVKMRGPGGNEAMVKAEKVKDAEARGWKVAP